jgi:hypothetical protein
LQLVHSSRSIADGAGFAVRPAWAQAAANSPPANGICSQGVSRTGRASATRSYHGSSVSRLIAAGHIRRPMLPRRSKTNRGARGIVAKKTTLPPPTQLPPRMLMPSPTTKSNARV